MRARHWLGFALLAFIWGTTWLGIKLVVREMPPLSAAGVRFALAAALLGLFGTLAGRRLAWRHLAPAERRLLFHLSLLMIAIPYGLVFYGELTVSSALAAILFSCHPAFVLLFDSLRHRRSLLTGAPLAGLVLAFVGILIIFLPRLDAAPGELRGALAIVAAAASSAVATVLAKYEAHHVDPLVGTTWQMAGASVWLLLVGLALERPAATGYSLTALAALLYLTVFGSCVTFVLYYALLKRMAPIELSTLSFIIPIIATAMGWLVLGERLAGTTIAGAAVALTGVAILYRREREPAYPAERPVPAGD
ncbi:MAG: DMT family transporter [Acidobacteria bacterium]|nr:DMT family transporter [Acidobacteriota bacterium]